MSDNPSDALVFFGATGDLAYKKIFPALHAMAKRGHLNVPVIAVGRGSWNLDRLRERARASIQEHGGVDPAAFEKLSGLMRYAGVEYTDASTFRALKKELGSAERPAFYLAIPPLLFEQVVEQLTNAGCAQNARVIVEKPFGHDLASAQELNQTLHRAFPESSIFRIDHYLGKRPVANVVVFRFANTFMEPFWNRNYIESIEITMAEKFGVEGRGAFYEQTGVIRDVIQNHLFQILSNLAMEPPVRSDSETIRDEKVKVLKAIPPIEAGKLVRGQFRGYRQEKGVAPDSKVETFAALELEVDSWRWKGVPFYLRAGKNLPVNCTEVLARFRTPPTVVWNTANRNHLRFRISPEMTIAIGASVLGSGEMMESEPAEIIASSQPCPEEMDAYERVLGEAMAGNGTSFARADYVDEAWRIVDPVLQAGTEVFPYDRGSWGPREAQERVSPGGGWHNPVTPDTRDLRIPCQPETQPEELHEARSL